MNEIITIAALAALFSLDITAFGQFMISRPIVCAPLIGYMLGDVRTGLWIGMTVELIWISSIPMGAVIPLETMAVSVLSVLWGLSIRPYDTAGVMVALCVSIPAGILFRSSDILVRYMNVAIMHWVENGVKDGKEGRISLGVYSGVLLFFLKAFILYVALIYPGRKITELIYGHLAPRVLEGLRLAWFLLPVMGMGLLLVNFRNGKFPCNKIEEIGRQKGNGHE